MGCAGVDLLSLVADKDMELGLQGLLTDPARVGIRPIRSTVLVHPKRDPGVLRQCHDFLRSQQRLASHALVLFDREGCGKVATRVALENEVETRLRQNGWEGRSAAVVIDPELEVWVWGGYAAVATALGWPGAGSALQEWLVQEGFLRLGQNKPERPKEALERTLYALRKPRSSSIYFHVARQLDTDACLDPAFLKLRATLQGWFPPETQH